jgi:hypothetical protein
MIHIIILYRRSYVQYILCEKMVYVFLRGDMSRQATRGLRRRPLKY